MVSGLVITGFMYHNYLFCVDLSTKTELDDGQIGIFNGKSLFRISTNTVVRFVQMLWRYGWDLFRMNSYVNAMLKKFGTIYEHQDSGKAFANVEDILEAMGGQQMSNLMKISADDCMRKDLHWNKTLVDELITGALHVNYGQDTSVNAFTALTSLAGMQSGSLWSVVGGNYKIAECVLKESRYSSLVMEDVVSVTKTLEEGGSVKYAIATEDGKIDKGFDVVIVANPLNTSSIKYDNFSSDVYTAAATTPYERVVATFCKGKINQQFFGVEATSPNFPLVILTTDMKSPPFLFNSIGLEVPSEVPQKEVKQYIQDEPVRVWKVFSPQPLTQDQRLSLFPDMNPNEVVSHDWLAYPHYEAPYQAPSFVLDDGVFYINAIEKASSAMEMSAIGAKNAALLARDYLLQQ